METTFKWIKKHVIATILAAIFLSLCGIAATRVQLPSKNKYDIKATQDSIRDHLKDIHQIRVDQI